MRSQPLTTPLWLLAVSACGHAASTAPTPASPGCEDGPRGCQAVETPRETRARVVAADRRRARTRFQEEVRRLRAQLASRTGTVAAVRLAAAGPSPEAVSDPKPLDTTDALSTRGFRPGAPGLSRPRREPRPSPELLRRGAYCVLAVDVPALESVLRDSRRAGREEAGRLALVWVDATELQRRLADEGTSGACEVDSVRPVVELLRDLVGASPTTIGDSLRYEQGVRRLAEELNEPG